MEYISSGNKTQIGNILPAKKKISECDNHHISKKKKLNVNYNHVFVQQKNNKKINLEAKRHRTL